MKKGSCLTYQSLSLLKRTIKHTIRRSLNVGSPALLSHTLAQSPRTLAHVHALTPVRTHVQAHALTRVHSHALLRAQVHTHAHETASSNPGRSPLTSPAWPPAPPILSQRRSRASTGVPTALPPPGPPSTPDTVIVPKHKPECFPPA